MVFDYVLLMYLILMSSFGLNAYASSAFRATSVNFCFKFNIFCSVLYVFKIF